MTSKLARPGPDFIADHHSDPLLGVRDVAAAMGTGRRQAERLFGTTGRTIRRQIEETRMERVRSLLATTPLSIRAIAEECGFSSGPYLSRLFKKRLGKTPGEWRREHAEDSPLAMPRQQGVATGSHVPPCLA